jgi:NADPH:quinone reductase-like Zn-dependent oxidoreductase
MYALQISTFGKPSDVVERVTIPDPDDPRANEVLVAVEDAPIDFSDLLTITGQYGVLPSLPTGLGSEGVGRILSVGEKVNHLKVGDCVLIPFSHSSWREKMMLPSTDLFPLPQGADPQQLSILDINPPTAALLLSEYAQLKPGDWVIQNAGNSGVGHSVIAFAKDRGLRTVSLVRRQELIGYTRGDVIEAVRASHPGGIHAVLDVATRDAAAFFGYTQCLRAGGRLLSTVYAVDPAHPGQATQRTLERSITAINIVCPRGPAALDRLSRLVEEEMTKRNQKKAPREIHLQTQFIVRESVAPGYERPASD